MKRREASARTGYACPKHPSAGYVLVTTYVDVAYCADPRCSCRALPVLAADPDSHRGAKNPNSRLKQADVDEIRRRVAAGERQNAVARDLGLDPSHVGRIVRGRLWRDHPKAI